MSHSTVTIQSHGIVGGATRVHTIQSSSRSASISTARKSWIQEPTPKLLEAPKKPKTRRDRCGTSLLTTRMSDLHGLSSVVHISTMNNCHPGPSHLGFVSLLPAMQLSPAALRRPYLSLRFTIPHFAPQTCTTRRPLSQQFSDASRFPGSHAHPTKYRHDLDCTKQLDKALGLEHLHLAIPQTLSLHTPHLIL